MVAKLGIVLATYNEAETLPPLIEMLEGLSVPLEIHIFVVDDSSPDGSSSGAQRLASQYGNISLITRPGKLGLGQNIRWAIFLIGAFIGFRLRIGRYSRVSLP